MDSKDRTWWKGKWAGIAVGGFFLALASAGALEFAKEMGWTLQLGALVTLNRRSR